MSLRPIKNADAAAMREKLKPITDLKPGDKVRWKSPDLITAGALEYGEEIEVFRTTFTNSVVETEAIHENDFTALFRNEDGEVIEYPFDSCRFERVEEERKEPVECVEEETEVSDR